MDEIAKQQQDIYERAYEIPGYGVNSHALDMIDQILPILKENECDKVLDAGCGGGKFLLKLLELNYDAHGVDIIDKALWSGVPADRFTMIPLWSISSPEMHGYFDAVICTDVMEHIPAEMVRQTIKSISDVCSKLAIFKISLNKEGHGRLIGEDLHPTIMTASQWRDQLTPHFEQITTLDSAPGNVVFCCRR